MTYILEDGTINIQAGETYIPRALFYYSGKYANDPPADIGEILPIQEFNGYRVGGMHCGYMIDYFFKGDDKRIRVMYVRQDRESSSWNYISAS